MVPREITSHYKLLKSTPLTVRHPSASRGEAVHGLSIHETEQFPDKPKAKPILEKLAEEFGQQLKAKTVRLLSRAAKLRE